MCCGQRVACRCQPGLIGTEARDGHRGRAPGLVGCRPSVGATNHHEVTLVQLSFDFYMLEAKPAHLIGDKAYDSDALDAAMKKDGVEMISPHRSNRKLKTQDGRPLRRYARRWLVERYFAWLHWKRRLVTRWEYYSSNFLGFVELASITILLKRF